MFVIDIEWYKSNVVFNAAIIIGALTKVFDRKKRTRSKDLYWAWLIFIVITVFSGMLQPVLAYPAYTYGMATIAAYGMLALWIAFYICKYWEKQRKEF